MKSFPLIAALFVFAVACNKSSAPVSKTYSGNFVLNSAIDLPLTGRMHILFSDVNFSGSGDSSVLPYVGSGVFRISGDSIYFTQTGAIPDIFGPSSILEGGFRLEKDDDSLVFSRNSQDGLLTPQISYRLHRN